MPQQPTADCLFSHMKDANIRMERKRNFSLGIFGNRMNDRIQQFLSCPYPVHKVIQWHGCQLFPLHPHEILVPGRLEWKYPFLHISDLRPPDIISLSGTVDMDMQVYQSLFIRHHLFKVAVVWAFGCSGSKVALQYFTKELTLILSNSESSKRKLTLSTRVEIPLPPPSIRLAYLSLRIDYLSSTSSNASPSISTIWR